MALADRAPVDCEPLTASAPDQEPDAVHAVALVDDQVNDVALPRVIELGFALKLTVGDGDLTETVADCAALPPAPVQVRVYVALAVSAPVERDPLVAWLPFQPPEAAQEVAFVVDQFKVEAPPLAMELGLAVRLTVGAGVGAVTDTVVACVAEPPGPVHVTEYVVLVLRAPVERDPLGTAVPFQPPDRAQDAALVDDQERTELAPLAIVLGFALKLTVGAGSLTETIAVCVALPPAPVQVRVYVAFDVRAPVDWELLRALLPDHAPEATQDVA